MDTIFQGCHITPNTKLLLSNASQVYKTPLSKMPVTSNAYSPAILCHRCNSIVHSSRMLMSMICPTKRTQPHATYKQTSSNCLPSAVGYLKSGLEISARIHQTPFVFPLLAGLIQPSLPWFIKRFKPIAISHQLMLKCVLTAKQALG